MRIGIDLRWLHQALSHQSAEECPGGIGAYSLYLTKHLLDVDAENSYLLFGSRAFSKELLAKHFPDGGRSTIVLLPYPPAVKMAQATLGLIFKQLWEQVNISPVLRTQKLDIMHFQEQGAILHSQPYKTVLTVHDMMLSVYDRRYFNNGISRWLWKKHVHNFNIANSIIAISNSTKCDIVAYASVKPERIQTIHYGLADVYKYKVDTAQVLDEKKKHGINDKYFLYVGGLQFNKNIPGIIEAFYQAAASDHKVQLVMVGEHQFWPYQRDQLAKQLVQYELEQRVVFTGQLNWKRLKPLYAGAVALVHPALYEGFGFTPLEAMACGCPVITSRTSSLPEVVGDAALLVDPANSGQIADFMRLLLLHPKEQERLRQKGLHRSRQFSWSVNAKCTLGIYQKTIESR